MLKFVKIENEIVNFINEEEFNNEIKNEENYYVSDDDCEIGFIEMYEIDNKLIMKIDYDENCIVGIMKIDEGYNIGIIDNDCENEMNYKIEMYI